MRHNLEIGRFKTELPAFRLTDRIKPDRSGKCQGLGPTPIWSVVKYYQLNVLRHLLLDFAAYVAIFDDDKCWTNIRA